MLCSSAIGERDAEMSVKPQNALVWAEIPVSDLRRAVSFYNSVFGYALSIDESGPNPMAILPTADGRQGRASLSGQTRRTAPAPPCTLPRPTGLKWQARALPVRAAKC